MPVAGKSRRSTLPTSKERSHEKASTHTSQDTNNEILSARKMARSLPVAERRGSGAILVAARHCLRLDVQRRGARQGRRRADLGGADHRADRRHRRLPARPHPPGEDRREETAPAGQGHPVPVPAVAGVRRPALAAGLAVGLLQAGPVQDGLRHRQGGARPRGRGAIRTADKDRGEELKQLRKRVAELETQLAAQIAAEGGKA